MEETIATIFSRLEDSSTRILEQEIFFDLYRVYNDYIHRGLLISLSLIAETFAFGFLADYPKRDSSWPSYYGPFSFSPSDIADKQIPFPDSTQITPDMINYWMQRSQASHNAVLRIRYADLCWEFMRKVCSNRPNIELARKVIDDTCLVAINNLCEHEKDTITKLKRALDLAVRIHDSKRIDEVAEAIINFENLIAQDDLPGIWGFAFDLLVDKQKIHLAEHQLTKVITDLESRLQRLSYNHTPSAVTPFAIEDARKRLVQYYRKTQQINDIRRIFRLYTDGMLRFSNHISPSIGRRWLREAHKLLTDNAFKEEADQIALKLRDLGIAATEELKSIMINTSIDEAKYKLFLKDITSSNTSEALNKFSIAFLPKANEIKQSLQNPIQNNSPQSMIPIEISDHEGRTISTIGTTEDDIDGRVVLKITEQMISLNTTLNLTLQHIINQYMLSPEDFINHLYQSPIFETDRRPIITIGTTSALQGEHIVALCVLIPEIEAALRHLLITHSISIYKPGRNGETLLRNLDEILRDPMVLQVFGEDIITYLRVLLVDARGWNIRNKICHGFLKTSDFQQVLTGRVLHALLLLSMLRSKNPQDYQ